MTQNKEKLRRYYFLTTFTVIAVIIMSIAVGFVIEEHSNFEKTIRTNKQNLMDSKKQTLKGIVDSVAQQVQLVIKESENNLEARIDERLNLAYSAASATYKAAQNKQEAEKDIKAALSGMTWSQNHIYIFDMQGNVISMPHQKHLEGKNILESPNAGPRQAMIDALKSLKNTDTAQFDVEWTKPDGTHSQPKHIKLRVFRPLNWVIGYGEYFDEFIGEVQNKLITQLESIHLPEDGYIFMSDYSGMSLTQPARNKFMLNVQDSNDKYIVQDMIKLAKKGGGFYEYVMPPFPGMKPEKKLSYVTGIKGWDWYIGTGIYLTDFENDYNLRMENEKRDSIKELTVVLLLLTAVLALAGVITFVMSNRMQKLIDRHNLEIKRKNEELRSLNITLESKVAEKTVELTLLNASLEKRVKNEIEKNREQEHIMFQQGRLAAMGEMLSNIAHQWRQPLNNIGLYIQDIQDAQDAGELTDEYLDKSVHTCLDIIQHMSATIDNFRDFFKPDKDKVLFDINDCIKQSLTLLRAGIENSHIEIRTDLEPCGKTKGVPGEYSQVLVNIITNAKDALIENKVRNPCITIRSHSENQIAVVSIENNGSGISDSVAEKIFEPYFTTKDEGRGTGIGLYFSKIIIEKNMGGKITFENIKQGVIFHISLPEADKDAAYL
ncbi:MAG: cache domain-containing protein [Deferribacterales bacterium]